MGMSVGVPYAPAVEESMRAFFRSLNEKDRRRYAALQARQLGYGGIEYVAKVLGCSRRTIERAGAELDDLPNDPAAGRVRRPGGGRKKSGRRAAAGGEPGVGAGGSHGGRSG